MRKIRNLSNKYLEIILLCILVLLFSIFMAIINHLPIVGGLYFFAFEIFAMLLPGVSFLLLLNITSISKTEFITLSYAMGYCMNIGIYYLFVPFGLKKIVLVGFILLFIASVIIIWKKRKNYINLKRDMSGNIICGVIILIIVGIETLSFCGANILPMHASETDIVNDLMYWIGNTIELTKEYPILDFREHTRPYTYHFFSSMQIAIISLTTNLQPVVLSFSYSFIQPIILMVLGSYCMFKRCSKRKILIVLGMILIFFVTGRESVTNIAYARRLYNVPFGFDIAWALYMLFIYIIMSQLKEEKINYRWFSLALVFFTVLLGVKAPNGAVALGVLGLVCFYWLIHKQVKKAFVYGIPILVMFGIIYYFVVNMQGWSLSNTSLAESISINTPFIYKMSYILSYYHETWSAFFGQGFLRYFGEFLFSIYVMILSNFVVYTLFWIMVSVKALLIKKWDVLDTVCVVVAFVGTLLTLNWGNQDGAVQYFLLIAYVTSTVFGIRSLEQCFNQRYLFAKSVQVIFCLGLSVFLLFGIKEFFAPSAGVSEAISEGLSNYENGTDISADINNREYVSNSEYEAYEWIRLNTEGNVLICANKGLQLGQNDSSRYSRAVGVFTERYSIKNNDTDALFYNLDYSRLEALKEFGIEYIIYNTTSTDGFVLNEEQGVCVFENDSSIIYYLY